LEKDYVHFYNYLINYLIHNISSFVRASLWGIYRKKVFIQQLEWHPLRHRRT